MEKLCKQYAWLLRKAENTNNRKEALSLIHQADAVLTDFDRHQDELLTFNEFNGDVEHEYDTTHSEDFLRGAELPEYDLEQLRGLVGGDDAFDDLMQWGSQNLNQEQIQEFDQIMASNDYPVMEEAILNLYNYYLENWSGEEVYEDYSEPEEQIEEVDEEDVGCQYLKVVQVVEVLDQDGNLFPDPNE